MSDDNDYRFYHCYHSTSHIVSCMRVDNPLVKAEKNNTTLTAIPTYIPKFMDKYIIKYASIPDLIVIENRRA